MKIIGKKNSDVLICEISKDEIFTVFNHSSCYSCDDAKLVGKMEVGNEIDLSTGYKFSKDITAACESLQKSHKNFLRANDSMLAFAEMILRSKDKSEDNEMAHEG